MLRRLYSGSRRVTWRPVLLVMALVAVMSAATAVAPLSAHACGNSPRDAGSRYYKNIDDQRLRGAWDCLSTATRRQFGGYREWSHGYRTTAWVRIKSIRVLDQAAGFADLSIRISSCRWRRDDALIERFSGNWEALNGYAGWRLHAPTVRRTSTTSRDRC